MALVPTALLAACALAFTILFGWLGARPANPLRGPRLVPWRFLMLLTFLGMVLALVHLVALVRSSGAAG